MQTEEDPKGTRRKEKKKDKTKCFACHSPIEPGAKYCPICDTELASEEWIGKPKAREYANYRTDFKRQFKDADLEPLSYEDWDKASTNLAKDQINQGSSSAESIPNDWAGKPRAKEYEDYRANFDGQGEPLAYDGWDMLTSLETEEDSLATPEDRAANNGKETNSPREPLHKICQNCGVQADKEEQTGCNSCFAPLDAYPDQSQFDFYIGGLEGLTQRRLARELSLLEETKRTGKGLHADKIEERILLLTTSPVAYFKKGIEETPAGFFAYHKEVKPMLEYIISDLEKNGLGEKEKPAATIEETDVTSEKNPLGLKINVDYFLGGFGLETLIEFPSESNGNKYVFVSISPDTPGKDKYRYEFSPDELRGFKIKEQDDENWYKEKEARKNIKTYLGEHFRYALVFEIPDRGYWELRDASDSVVTLLSREDSKTTMEMPLSDFQEMFKPKDPKSETSTSATEITGTTDNSAGKEKSVAEESPHELLEKIKSGRYIISFIDSHGHTDVMLKEVRNVEHVGNVYDFAAPGGDEIIRQIEEKYLLEALETGGVKLKEEQAPKKEEPHEPLKTKKDLLAGLKEGATLLIPKNKIKGFEGNLKIKELPNQGNENNYVFVHEAIWDKEFEGEIRVSPDQLREVLENREQERSREFLAITEKYERTLDLIEQAIASTEKGAYETYSRLRRDTFVLISEFQSFYDVSGYEEVQKRIQGKSLKVRHKGQNKWGRVEEAEERIPTTKSDIEANGRNERNAVGKLAALKEERLRPTERIGYPAESIESIILSLLDLPEAKKSIAKITRAPKIRIAGDELKFTVSFTGKKMGMSVNDVDLELGFGIKDGEIIIKNHKIIASKFQEQTEKGIIPLFNKISPAIKSYLETKKGQKVENLEIGNGQLIATFARQISQTPSTEEQRLEKVISECKQNSITLAERLATATAIVAEAKGEIPVNAPVAEVETSAEATITGTSQEKNPQPAAVSELEISNAYQAYIKKCILEGSIGKFLTYYEWRNLNYPEKTQPVAAKMTPEPVKKVEAGQRAAIEAKIAAERQELLAIYARLDVIRAGNEPKEKPAVTEAEPTAEMKKMIADLMELGEKCLNWPRSLDEFIKEWEELGNPSTEIKGLYSEEIKSVPLVILVKNPDGDFFCIPNTTDWGPLEGGFFEFKGRDIPGARISKLIKVARVKKIDENFMPVEVGYVQLAG